MLASTPVPANQQPADHSGRRIALLHHRGVRLHRRVSSCAFSQRHLAPARCARGFVCVPGCYRRTMAAYSTVEDDTVFFRPCAEEDIATICELEALGYPADEAATPEGIRARAASAPGCFLTAVQGRYENTVVGFVNGTLTKSPTLTHESMETHEPDGTTLCIHSVCVSSDVRRRGVGSRMLKAYVQFVQQTTPQLASIRLICKEHLVGFYQAGGFKMVGPSPVVHGTDPWIEMALECGDISEIPAEDTDGPCGRVGGGSAKL